ncbi:MAG: heparinase II/III family protein [Armatimonadota bacterium]
MEKAIISVGLFVACLSIVHAAGQAMDIDHPALEHGINPDSAEAYERNCDRVMAMSIEEMLSFVPEKPTCRFCYCPNCHGGSQGSGIYSWSIENPDQVRCKYCGMVFPNEKYPLDKTIEGKNAHGETVTYRYHQDQERDDLRIFIPAHIMMHKRAWILDQLHNLGVAWQATKKPEYARRAALILDRIAQVYPHYPMMRQWITTFKFPGDQKPPFSGAGGRWGRWMASELPADVVRAYDLVYDSEEFDRLSQERGYDVREKIEEDFLKATWEYVNTFETHTHNMAPSYLRTAIEMGRVIRQPEYVHWAYRWLLEILHGGCFYDGCWREAPSYHFQVIGGLKNAFDALRGYSDPPGYVDEGDGKRFDNMEPDEDIAFYDTARGAFDPVAYPNGYASCIHDTWPHSRRSAPRSETNSGILPGYGHASLGRGRGDNQMQAQLHFSGGHGHTHLDNLNLALWAKGHEMLCDLGYTHTKLRWWNICTIGHNLVAIDRANQNGSNSDGNLLHYFPDTGGVAMVEADGRRAYHAIEDLQTYRRMLVTVPVSSADAYVVDIFRTVGGSTHDWLLHGDADDDMTATCSVPLTGQRENLLESEDTWEEPKTEGSRFNPYGVIRDVKTSGDVTDAVTTFRYTESPEEGVRIHLAGESQSLLMLGKSPSVRKAGRDSGAVYDYWMPQMVVRRTGEAPLSTVFTMVEEPFSEATFIDTVERLQVQPDDTDAVALRIRHGEIVDTVLASPSKDTCSADGITLAGRLGIVRHDQGRVTGMWLFEGTELQCAGAAVEAPAASYSGTIAGAQRISDGADTDALFTDADLPEDRALHGMWMIVSHPNGRTHGYEIERVEHRDGQTAIVLTMDHGLRIEGEKTSHVFFPQSTMEGENTFVIPLATSVYLQD